jgi:hypothetical protein
MIESNLTSLSDALERDGYLALPGFFSNERIEEVEAAVRRACSARAMDIVIDDLVTGERVFYGLAANRQRGWFKLNDLYPQSVRARPERFDEAHPFPEKTYLRRHPDVRAAVAERRIPSAFAHYREHGFTEGRGI